MTPDAAIVVRAARIGRAAGSPLPAHAPMPAMLRLPRRPALALAAALTTAALPAAAGAQSSIAQSFTVPGAPNTVLAFLTVSSEGLEGFDAQGSGDFVADIFAYTGGSLVGPSLFSQVLGPTFAGLALTPGIALVPGATYAVAVAQAGGSMSAKAVGDAYAGGAFLACANATGACTSPFGNDDDLAGFAVRFEAATTTAPEPGTWALLGTGLVAVGAVTRRRTRVADPRG